MSDRLQIVLTASNGTRVVFQEVTRDAQTMATDVTQSGDRAGASFEKIGNAVGKLGLAFAAFSLIAGKAAGDSDASAARLETSFENAGQAVSDFQSQINQLDTQGLHLAFDDEDVNDALARLVGVTKDVQQSFADVTLAENIARGEQMSLAASTQIVVQAESGRFRGLAALGIAIDSTTTKQQALAAAQAKYAGEAAAYSKTQSASIDRIKNSTENLLEVAGGKLNAVQGPLLAISATAATIGPVTKAIKEIGGAEKTAELASSALGVAMGPVGLGLAVAGAAAAFVLLTDRTAEWEDAAKAASGAVTTLNDEIYRLAAGGSTGTASALKGVSDEWDALAKQGADIVKQISDINDQIATLNNQKSNSQPPLTADEQAQVDAQIAQLEALRDQLNKLALDSDQINTITAAIQDLFMKPGIDARQAGKDIAWYFSQFEQGKISADQLVAWLVESDQDWTRYSNAVVLSTDAQDSFNAAMQKTVDMMNVQLGAIDANRAAYQMHVDAAAAISMTAMGRYSVTLADARQQAAETAGALESSMYVAITTTNAWSANQAAAQAKSKTDFSAWAGSMEQSMGTAITATNEWSQAQYAAFQDAQKAADDSSRSIVGYFAAEAQQAAAAQQAIAGYAQALGQVPALADSGAAGLAQHVTQTGTALGDAFRVAVGNTDAIGQQASSVNDWATNLINVRGTYGEIDKLRAKGIIDEHEYARAQSAETSILHSNAAIQRDVLKIQTDQAPVIARLTKEQREYMGALAAQSPEQQLVSLGYMDATESAKAYQAAQLAAAAAAGELGKAGEATATKIITGAAEADPVLRSMLEDMGLISVGTDGTITVHFDSVTDAKDGMDKLVDKIGDLIKLLEDIFHIKVDDGDVSAAADEVYRLGSNLDGLNNREVHYSVIGNYTVTGDASSVPVVGGSTGGDIGGGSSSSAAGGSDPFGSGSGAASGGYATGGMVRTGLAEYGPEMIRLAGGGVAMAWERGIYSVPRGSYVETAPATRNLEPLGGVTVNVTINGVGMSTDEIVRELVPAIVAATKQHYAGHGLRG